MSLFKGYVLTQNKKSIDKFKDGSLRTYDEVKDADEYAGVLSDDTILIDIDDKLQSKILMDIVEDKQLNCKVIQTARGRHFLFKNSKIDKCSTHKMLACGITSDIKVGVKNSYEVLKFQGEERFVEWDSDEYEEVPKWLFPVSRHIDFFDMSEGDGRNQTLFNYILTLTSEGFSKEEARETINIINEYILEEKLSQDEVDTILRDEAFPTDVFFVKGKFLHDMFAKFIMGNYHVVRINGQLHIYKDGEYIPGEKDIEATMIKQIPVLKASQRSEVLKYLEIIAPEVEKADARYIGFKNGIYDVVTKSLIPFNPNIILTNLIPWDYVPEMYSEIASTTLNKLSCNNPKVRAVLEECIGYCFYRRNELSKAFILTGEKSNGKSTFLDMVSNLLGQDNISALDIGEMDERFSTATLAGKLANIGDDISDEFLNGKSVAMFKKIVTGNQVKAEFKGKDPFFFSPVCKLLFSANDIPRIKDKTGAVLRRLVIIPFNARFSKSDPDYDPYITYKLREREVMEYLVQLGITGLHRVLENNDFTMDESVQEAIGKYAIENNPILFFISEFGKESIVNQNNQTVYSKYKQFCFDAGFSPMGITAFSRNICRELNLESKQQKINGNIVRIYVQR